MAPRSAATCHCQCHKAKNRSRYGGTCRLPVLPCGVRSGSGVDGTPAFCDRSTFSDQHRRKKTRGQTSVEVSKEGRRRRRVTRTVLELSRWRPDFGPCHPRTHARVDVPHPLQLLQRAGDGPLLASACQRWRLASVGALEHLVRVRVRCLGRVRVRCLVGLELGLGRGLGLENLGDRRPVEGRTRQCRAWLGLGLESG